MSKKGSFWTLEEDEELMRRYKGGERLDVISASLGRTKDAMADRYRRLMSGGGKATKRPPPIPAKPLTLREKAEAVIRHEGACMREAGVTNRQDLAAYYRARCELAIEPGPSVTTYAPTSFSHSRSCVGSPAAMAEGN